MAAQSIAKRPVVFTWAELQKYPTLEARYAETLPFKHYNCWNWCSCGFSKHCKCECKCNHKYNSSVQLMEKFAKCIKRTGERWAWFSAARDLDDKRGESLGTLGYLPWEIRQNILEFILQSSFRSWKGTNIVQCTKVEFEHCYLTKTTFAFEQPKALESFLDGLSKYQQSLLRSFKLSLCDYESFYYIDVSNWLRICDLLPSNLVSIELCAGVISVKEPGEKWFIRDEVQVFPRVELIIEFLNTLGKRVHRRAARAKIGLVVDRDNRSQDGMPWFPVLDELEPWSKDWLEWWEEDTKVNLNKGERAKDRA